MQLPYTVINVWRAITVWRGHSRVGAIHVWMGHYRAATAHGNWWLVRATYVVDGLFFGHFFWKVVGTVCIHGNT